MKKTRILSGVLILSLMFVMLPVFGSVADAEEGGFTVFRFYNSDTGEHLYTTDLDERQELILSGIWAEETPSGTSFMGGTAIYRLSNPATGEVLYSSSKKERNHLVKEMGWTLENDGEPVFFGSDQGSLDVYRLFNPDARDAATSHHFTSDKTEIKRLLKTGWEYDNNSEPVWNLDTYKKRYSTPRQDDYAKDLQNIIEDSEEEGISEEGEFATRRIIVLKPFNSIGYDYNASDACTISEVSIFQYDNETDAENAYNAFSNQFGEELVEADTIVSAISGTKESDTSIKEAFTKLVGDRDHLSYGPQLIGSDAYIDKMGSATNTTITVAVIDTGVSSSHPFLSGKLLNGTGYYNNGSPEDDHGHGTHVAGIIVDTTKGASVNILPIKVLDSTGNGYNSTVASGIQYAVEHGANVINLSLGGYDYGSSHYLDNVVNDATSKGVTVVAGAGNDSTDAAYFCPGHVSSVICVAAVDSNMERAYFSNYGKSIAVSAPGVNINSTYLNGQYINFDGTSMATPFVAAACALVKAANPDARPKDIKSALMGASTDRGETGWDQYYGQGVLNLAPLAGQPISVSPQPDPEPTPAPAPTPTPTPAPSPSPTPTPNPNPGQPWNGWTPPQIPDNVDIVPMYGVSVNSSSSNGVGKAVITIRTTADTSKFSFTVDGKDCRKKLKKTENGYTYTTTASGNHYYEVVYSGAVYSGSFTL